ncbi:MAG: peptidase dimerization domain-containing protein [bacterium]
MILDALPDLVERVKETRDVILGNLVMLGEIPAPTFDEGDRIEFLMQRFSECGMQNCSTDEVGNGVGVLPGTDGTSSILLVAHPDTIFSRKVDHTVSVQSDSVVGPGVADNSLGVATLASLPTLLEMLGIHFRSDLILLGGVRSLGRGNIEGLRFFLGNNSMPIQTGICIEGVQLGRLSHSSIGMLRGEVTCTIPEQYDWTRFGASSAIVTLNEVITRIQEIPLPRRPKTHIFLGSISGGGSFNTIARNAELRFELRSESEEIVRDLDDQIQDIAAEVSAEAGVDVVVDQYARREPGGIGFRHPLAVTARKVLSELGIQPMLGPSTSELSAFIDRHIPAITLGLTKGENLNDVNETIFIDPMFKGLAQLLAILQAADKGCCNED